MIGWFSWSACTNSSEVVSANLTSRMDREGLLCNNSYSISFSVAAQAAISQEGRSFPINSARYANWTGSSSAINTVVKSLALPLLLEYVLYYPGTHMNSQKSKIFSILALAAAIVCSPGAHAQELVVSAAASLTNAFQAMGKAFEATVPGAKLTFNFAASGPLLAQIQQGAPVDVFASADEETMNRAASAKLLADGTRFDFAQNTLVLVVPAGATIPPARTLQDLTGPAYKRIAVGTSTSVPAGRYTMDAVQQAGLTTPLQSKWIYGESVRQVLNYVARGEVDAGFVYGTDAAIERDKIRTVFAVPTPTPVRYPIAQVATSKNSAMGKSFVEFVRGNQGQAILAEFGFSRATGGDPASNHR